MESKLNIELFKKVRERISAIPESYDQQCWMSGSSSAPCGTAACLAGEAIICAAASVEQGISDLKRYVRNEEVPAVAASLLGLRGDWWDEDDESEINIFGAGGHYWPEPYRGQFRRARSQSGKAQAAVAYLDHIIETGKVLE